MKPEKQRRQKEKESNWTACNWFLAIVEKVNPTPRLAAMNKTNASDSRTRLPSMGTANKTLAAMR